MSEVNYICEYCNFKWTKPVSAVSWMSIKDLEDPKCPKCKDTNVKIIQQDASKKDVFGYNK